MVEITGATASDSPVMQGRNAREYGRGRDSCPYPEGSAERQGWLEGFDNVTAEDAPSPAASLRPGPAAGTGGREA